MPVMNPNWNPNPDPSMRFRESNQDKKSKDRSSPLLVGGRLEMRVSFKSYSSL